MSAPSYDVVVPTAGRGTLGALLEALGQAALRAPEAAPGRVLLVDDRRHDAGEPLLDGVPAPLRGRVEAVRGRAAGPAAARNEGWRASRAEWVAFLDDDVRPRPDWCERLAGDLGAAAADVGGVQGVVHVPLPADRRPTDWERNVAGLERARWATADMAYRREALAAVGGFDERFPRAYREDADLALRAMGAGWRLTGGSRAVDHPVRPAGALVSVRLQAGNADDVLMRALHGPGWRERAGAPAGRLRRHLAVTAAGAVGLGGALARRPRLATAGLSAWLAGTAELAWRRIAPGPRAPREVATMAATSALLPVAAAWHWARGCLRLPRLLADAERAPRPGGAPRTAPAARPSAGSNGAAAPSGPPGRSTGAAAASRGRAPSTGAAAPARSEAPAAVLLDRDGTLIADVPYNGDPTRVAPLPGAREALERLRRAGIPLAVVSNQSGVARGLISRDDVDAVNRRVEQLLGPLGPWAVCPHSPDEGCDCRKPAPGLVLRAAEQLGVPAERCAVIGDIGADVDAARAAGARPVLVPTPRTRPEEVEAAPEVAADLESAVELLIGGGER